MSSTAAILYGDTIKGRTFRVEGLSEVPTECNGTALIEANGDNLSVLEYGELAALKPGQSAFFGGGAAPEVEIRRLT